MSFCGFGAFNAILYSSHVLQPSLLSARPFLNKCFEGINRVTFTQGSTKGLELTHMISSEKETVALIDPVYPESGRNKGNVEMWLLELQASMRKSLKIITADSIEKYPHSLRTDFILKFPAQVVLAATQLYWTSDGT